MTTTSTRRAATAADLTEGTIAYKGKGKVAHRVVRVENFDGYGVVAWLTREGSKATTAPHWELVAKLTIEA